MSWTIEMRWCCPYCQTVNPGITGSERQSLRCTNCGAEKKESTPWLMPPDVTAAPALTGDAEERALAGANWTCDLCTAECRNTQEGCDWCGAPRKRRTPPVPPPPAAPRPEEVATYRTSAGPAVVSEPQVSEHFRSRLAVQARVLALVGGGLALGALALQFFHWLLTPNHDVVRVTHMTWMREHVVQEEHSYHGESWRDVAPSGVYRWNECHSRQRGTEQCRPHDCNCRDVRYSCNCTGGSSYSCNCRRSCSTSCRSNRNGSATCSERCSTACSTCTTPRVCSTCTRQRCDTCYDQCPVYAQWCSYEYYQWDELRRAALYGEGPDAVSPALNAQGPEQRLLRQEEYAVRFEAVGAPRIWTERFAYARYHQFQVGQRWELEWTRAGAFRLLRQMR